MAAIKTVAEAKGWFYALFGDKIPDDLDAITLADLTPGTDVLACHMVTAASDTRFDFTDSDNIQDPAYGERGGSVAYGRRHWEGSIAPFKMHDEDDGEYDAAANALITKLDALVLSRGKFCIVAGCTGLPDEERAEGDMYNAFMFGADAATAPAEVGAYDKFIYKLGEGGSYAYHGLLLAAPAGP